MAAWGYEFYLRVLKISLTSERSSLVRDTFEIRIPKRPCNVLFIYIDADEIFTLKTTFFSSFSKQQKGIIYCIMPVTEMF